MRKKEAARIAGSFLCDALNRLWRDGDWTIWVRDDTGLQLFSVMLIALLAPAAPGADHRKSPRS